MADKATILVIDDESLLAQTIELGLADDYEVVIAETGAAALEQLKGEVPWAAILCDLKLPDLSGKDIYEFIVENRKADIGKFVLMTGGAITADSRAFVGNYTGPVLEKPFSLGDLESMVHSVVVGEASA